MMSTMLRVCSVQLAEERRGREGRMGDNLWSGLGEMFGFSWHLHFHYPGLHDLSCFTLRINQIPNILSLFVSSLQRSAPHLSPCEPAITRHDTCLYPRILDLLAGPGAGDDDGGAPQSVPGRVWVACVIPSVLSQSEASIVTSDQSEASVDPCHPITRHTVTWEHKNNLPSTTNTFGQYLFLPKSVKSLRL